MLSLLLRPISKCILTIGLIPLLGAPLGAQTLTSPPAEALAGEPLSLSWSGDAHSSVYITVVLPEAGDAAYGEYAYLRDGNPLQLFMPQTPGTYELRLNHEENGSVVYRKKILIKPVKAELEAPASAGMGTKISVTWKGPNFPNDYLTITKPEDADNVYGDYQMTASGNPLAITAPDGSGTYELRYVLGRTDTVVGRRKIEISAVDSQVSGPASAVVGTVIDVSWRGPGNPQDYITIVPPDSSEETWDLWAMVDQGSPLKLRCPDQPGNYQLRYVSAGGKVLARTPIILKDVQATLECPTSVDAGNEISVNWTGPDNPGDYLLLERPGKGNTWVYVTGDPVTKGNPLTLTMPKIGGSYRLSYQLESGRVIAERSIDVKATVDPGSLRVTGSAGGLTSDSAVAVVLDASGSMLKREDGKRRMDIAKEALSSLLGERIPEGTALSLRVFGNREAGACTTDLEIPLQPLDPNAALETVRGIQAKNLAKTPIGDSLAKVAEDLGDHKGDTLVLLITDGEETCGGDAAAAIRQLRASGIQVRVNIVGFAINEPALKDTFRAWAKLGEGNFFDAKDSKKLGGMLEDAVNTPYRILDQQGKVVATSHVNGPEVPLNPGQYQLVVGANKPQPIEIRSGHLLEVSH